MVDFQNDEMHYIDFRADGGSDLKNLTIVDTNNQKISIESLMKTVNNVVKDQKEKCKKVFDLGLCIFDEPRQAESFLVAWLIRGVINQHEKTNGSKLEIKIDVVSLSEQETAERLAASMEELALNIRSNPSRAKSQGSSSANIDIGDLMS